MIRAAWIDDALLVDRLNAEERLAAVAIASRPPGIPLTIDGVSALAQDHE